MDSKDLFTKAIEEANGCIKEVRDNQLTNDTPCSEWDLKQLLNHMVYELLWAPDLFLGKTVAEVGDKYEGDVLGDDVQGSWQKAADKASQAISNATEKQVIHLSYGDVAAEHYIKELTADMLIHGWDVGQAINCTLLFDKELAQIIYDFALPQEKAYEASRAFGPKIAVPNSADMQTKLLAFYGRKARPV